MTRKHLLAAMALLALTPLLATNTLAKKGGNKPPKPPPGPADPAIVCVVDWLSVEAKVVVMDEDGGNQTVVHTTVGPVTEPTWAPGGNAIAFLKNNELWRIDIALVDGVPQGGNPQRIQAGRADDRFGRPQWSPAGNEIFYTAQGDDYYELRAVPANGGTPRVVYDPPSGGLGRPTFSPDGHRVAFTMGAVGPTSGIQVLDLDTGVVSTVLSGWTDGFKDLDWSRTDDVLAFIDSDEGPGRDHRRGGRLFTIDLDTGVLTFHLEGAEELTWLPDVAEIVFVGVNYKKWKLGGLRTYDPVTGAMTKIAEDVRWPDGIR